MNATMRVAAFSLAALAISLACRPGPTRESGLPPPMPDSPRATLSALLSAWRTGDRAQVGRLIVPGRAAGVLETLAALDEFLSANQRLVSDVELHFSAALADGIDQSQLRATRDIFSDYVEWLDECSAGDEATVGYVVDGRLPARTARLRRIDGYWRYDPGDGFDPRLPAALKRMAAGLADLQRRLADGTLDAGAIRANPDILLEEVMRTLAPGVALLPSPPTTQP